jgi:hypothetical protein
MLFELRGIKGQVLCFDLFHDLGHPIPQFGNSYQGCIFL